MVDFRESKKGAKAGSLFFKKNLSLVHGRKQKGGSHTESFDLDTQKPPPTASN
jgi:hypothetical protein